VSHVLFSGSPTRLLCLFSLRDYVIAAGEAQPYDVFSVFNICKHYFSFLSRTDRHFVSPRNPIFGTVGYFGCILCLPLSLPDCLDLLSGRHHFFLPKEDPPQTFPRFSLVNVVCRHYFELQTFFAPPPPPLRRRFCDLFLPFLALRFVIVTKMMKLEPHSSHWDPHCVTLPTSFVCQTPANLPEN